MRCRQFDPGSRHKNPVRGVFSFSDTIRKMAFLKRYRNVFLLALGVCVIITIAFFGFSAAQTKTWRIWLPGASEALLVKSREKLPARILSDGNIEISEGDLVFNNGIPVDINTPLGNTNPMLQIKRAVQITFTEGGNTRTFYSSAHTLGEALWQQGIILRASDNLLPPADTPLQEPISVELRRGQPLRILTAGKEILLTSAADKVGATLAEVGISLQGLDYSIPAEDQPIPADRTIKIVRVREDVVLTQTTIPFPIEQIADAELELDQSKVLQAGELGIKASRQRVRYEDGQETARVTESEWVAQEPKAQKTAYGTKIVIHTANTPAGPIEYWRAVTVYITSYKDTGSRTSSGTWPVKGDIAVILPWYRAFKGMRMYVPGYGIGVVSDVCPGCVGKPWIDVFIPTAEYVGWSKTQTVYFLTPIPANPLVVLP